MAEPSQDRRTVVVTRPADQAEAMIAALADRFAVVALPMIEVVPPDDGGAALRRAVDNLDRYAWVVVTSTNGASALCAALSAAHRSIGGSARIAAIGERTAAAMTAAGHSVDFVPATFEPGAFVDGFPEPEGDAVVLLARSAAGSDVLPEGLSAKGWRIEDVATHRPADTTPDAEQMAAAANADVVTFTSASAVVRFHELLDGRPCPAAVASIGPATSEAAERLGFTVSIEPPQHTVTDLVAAVHEWATRQL